MNQFLKKIKQYFGFSNGESAGFLLLIFLLLIFLFSPFLYKLILPNNNNLPNTADEEKLKLLQAELALKIDKTALEANPNFKENDFKYDQFSTENKSKTVNYFKFDPNKTEKEGFVSLGIPPFIAERIIKYRNAGGKFKTKEDLKKIYGLLPATYSKLAPYISIDENNSSTNEYSKSEKPVFSSETSLPLPNKFAKKPVAFDLNQADTTALMNLKGIGSKLSQRIIKFRENLGGFYTENQVKEVFGLDSIVVTEILKYGKIKTGFKKININTAQEIKHPYLKPYQSKAIIAYRIQHGEFQNVDDLSKIKILDPTTLSKIKPYLIVQ
jgi:competence protein ComEA